MAYERDLLANLYQRNIPHLWMRCRSERKNISTWKKTPDLENLLFDPDSPTETKIKSPKRRKIDKGKKLKNIIITPLLGCPWWMFTKKSTTQKKYPQLYYSKAKKEEEIGTNTVRIIESEDIPPTNAST